MKNNYFAEQLLTVASTLHLTAYMTKNANNEPPCGRLLHLLDKYYALQLPFSPSCAFSSPPQYFFGISIGKFGAKNIFANHRTANTIHTIQLFVAIK